jgi:GNAT superfamily N-acetyltransferase
MQPTTATDIRLLFESDIPAAMQLKEAAKWNQTEADWRRLLTLEPDGCFGAIKDGRLVGTTTTTTYGSDLTWIGMVLVDPQHRRQGIAAQLMKVALDYLKGKVTTIKLDATALGQPVYEKFGFEVESLIERWSGVANSSDSNTPGETVVDRDELFALDQLAFNANRSKLLAELMINAPVSPVVVRAADGSINGYALARSGTRAVYVGPVVAKDDRQAEMLLDQVLSQLDGRRVYIDFNTECSMSTSVLSDRGFVKERELFRMRAGSPAAKTSPMVVAIAAPETG